eukprot:4148674-Pyramimonas_sp.AAC.1
MTSECAAMGLHSRQYQCQYAVLFSEHMVCLYKDVYAVIAVTMARDPSGGLLVFSIERIETARCIQSLPQCHTESISQISKHGFLPCCSCQSRKPAHRLVAA